MKRNIGTRLKNVYAISFYQIEIKFTEQLMYSSSIDVRSKST